MEEKLIEKVEEPIKQILEDGVNMNNIEQYVDSKVANLTFVVNSLDGKCSSKCPRQEQIQSLPGMYNNVFLSFVDECYITQ